MTPPKLIYFRHGETDWNSQLRFQGQQDIALNAHGREQARANGQKLRELVGQGEGFQFISSPLGRSRETMEIVRTQMGLDPMAYAVDNRLIEASYGVLEGTTLPEFKAASPEEHRYRKDNRWQYQPEGGESHAMVLERILPWYLSLECDSIVCAHGVVGRVLRRHLLGIEPEEAASYAFPQDRVMVWQPGSETMI
ncbi:MAG: histidine phosphatase family protein [Rhizobiaceae bacterium]